MAIIRFPLLPYPALRLPASADMAACAISSIVLLGLAGCSSVEQQNGSSAEVSEAEKPADTAASGMGSQPTVTLTKTRRLPIPATSLPGVATTSATLGPSSETASNSQWTVPATSTILAASRQDVSQSATVGRLVAPSVAPAVSEGKIQPAAAQAIALDEPELTPDMAALQSVVPMPRPDRPTITAKHAPVPTSSSSTTLAYAARSNPIAALAALEFPPAPGAPLPPSAAKASPKLMALIKRYAGLYGVPESLVHRVVHRESRYNPKAYHKDGYWGLMQIKYSTAKSMGYGGPAKGLLDAETNLKYAIKYLRGAWLVADNQNDDAIKLYARGYYYAAKRKDMLHVLRK